MKRTTVFDEMNRLFDEMRHSMSDSHFDMGYRPRSVPVRTETDEDGYVVHADLPGFERSEIDLRFDDGILTIDAHHDGTDDGETWSRSVHEELRVSGTVEIDDIEASYHNGVLEVRLPTEDPTDVPGHRIEIS